MTHQDSPLPPLGRYRALLPWMVSAAALLFYACTVSHWVTLPGLQILAKMNQWEWRASLSSPLLYLLSLPFRGLPASAQPLILNLFTALMAAGVLGLLVRSVLLLPHDRTRDQRQKIRHPGAILTMPGAWLPPVLAALACGLQLTFWEHATSYTGEMLDLLIFAYVIRCLLEFRVNHEDGWLYRAAVVYGLGMTNNWALLGFLPFFLATIVWIKGRTFFNLRFLGLMLGLGLLGMLPYLVLPWIHSLGEYALGSFGTLLKLELGGQKQSLLAVPRSQVLVLALTSLLPVVVMGIKWPAELGDTSRAGTALTSFMFRLIHVGFLGLALWVSFDYKFSPRVLNSFQSFLTFYYLGALAIGYCSGYILLVMGKTQGPENRWDRSHPMARLAGMALVLITFACLMAVPVGLLLRNARPILSVNHEGSLFKFAQSMAASIPARGALVLSDDSSRLHLLQAYYNRENRSRDNLLLDTSSLGFKIYHDHLHRHFPGFAPELYPLKDLPQTIDPTKCLQLVEKLASGHPLYYLHSSFGYYFERFYPVPHGLVYELKKFDDQNLLPTPPSSAVLAENRASWKKITDEITPGVQRKGAAQMLQNQVLAGYLTKGFNTWGVDLQKSSLYPEAQAQFQQALLLQSNNVAAEINLDYNRFRQQGPQSLRLNAEEMQKKLGPYRSIENILTFFGPIDEPSQTFLMGQTLGVGGNLRQSLQWLHRTLELDTNSYTAHLALARSYLDMGKPDLAETHIGLVRQVLVNKPMPEGLPIELLSLQTMTLLKKGKVTEAEAALTAEFKRHPKDADLSRMLSQFYLANGQSTNALKMVEQQLQEDPKNPLHFLNKGLILAQNRRYTEALAAIDSALAQQPNHEGALFYKAEVLMASGQFDQAIELFNRQLQLDPKNVGALIKRGSLFIQQKKYEQGIDSLSEALKIQPATPVALLNRAIAYLQSNQLKKAQKDYIALLELAPESYQASFGLGEIAFRQKESNDALSRYTHYLQNAPKSTEEYKMVENRMKDLKTSQR